MQGALWALKSQVTRQGGIRKLQLPITHEIDTLEITFFFKGRWDYDNGLKATNDLLTKGGVISDDSIITKALIRKVKVARKEDERVEITL